MPASPGPDPTTCGGRCGWEETPLVRCTPVIAHIGRGQGYKVGTQNAHRAGRAPHSHRSVGVSNHPTPFGSDPNQLVASSQVHQDITLHCHHDTGQIHHHSLCSIVQCCLSSLTEGDWHRASLWIPFIHGLSAGEGEQGISPIRAGDRNGSHVTGLVVGHPVLVVLNLTQNRYHGDQHPRILEHRDQRSKTSARGLRVSGKGSYQSR